jgi:hypothetical protein
VTNSTPLSLFHYYFKGEFTLGVRSMKVKYQLPILTREQRIMLEFLLLEEVEKQAWYAVLFLKLWKTEGCICMQ